MGFPGGSDGKESSCNAGDPDLIPGSGRSPGEGNGYPLQYSCLGIPMDRGVGRLQSMGLQRVDTTEQLNNNKKKTEAQRGNKTCPNRKVANSKIRKSFFFLTLRFLFFFFF